MTKGKEEDKKLVSNANNLQSKECITAKKKWRNFLSEWSNK